MPTRWSCGCLATALALATSLAWAEAWADSQPSPVQSPRVSPPAAAAREACTSREACLAELQRAQSSTRSISARFRQVKHTALLDEPLVSTGRFYFARPDRVRLELESPTPLRLEVVGGKLIAGPEGLRDEGGGDTTARAGSPAAVAGMLARMGSLFSGAVSELEGSFDVQARSWPGSGALASSTPSGAALGGIEVVLIPRDESWRRLYRRIVLRFTGPELLATRVELEDGLGDSLEIELLEPRRNGPDPMAADAK